MDHCVSPILPEPLTWPPPCTICMYPIFPCLQLHGYTCVCSLNTLWRVCMHSHSLLGLPVSTSPSPASVFGCTQVQILCPSNLVIDKGLLECRTKICSSLMNYKARWSLTSPYRDKLLSAALMGIWWPMIPSSLLHQRCTECSCLTFSLWSPPYWTGCQW